jgi:hypothetical protein
VFPLNLYAHVRFVLMHIAHETAGAARTRSSLRPLEFWGANDLQASDETMSRERGVTSRRPCERRDPYAVSSLFGNEVDAFFSDWRQGLWVPACAQECPGKKFASRYKCLQ